MADNDCWLTIVTWQSRLRIYDWLAVIINNRLSIMAMIHLVVKLDHQLDRKVPSGLQLIRQKRISGCVCVLVSVRGRARAPPSALPRISEHVHPSVSRSLNINWVGGDATVNWSNWRRYSFTSADKRFGVIALLSVNSLSPAIDSSDCQNNRWISWLFIAISLITSGQL